MTCLLLAACGGTTSPTGQPTETITLPSENAGQQAGDAFRQHLAEFGGQLPADLKVLAEDIASGDAASVRSDAQFFDNDANTELAWLASNPPPDCIAPAWTDWKSTVTAAKGVFDSVVAGQRVDPTVFMDVEAQFSSFAITGSC